jgi:hypothetical protein
MHTKKKLKTKLFVFTFPIFSLLTNAQSDSFRGFGSQILFGPFNSTPSQFADERNNFMTQLDTNLLHEVILLGGDFNCRSNMRWDMGTLIPRDMLYDVSMQNALSQLIHQSTRMENLLNNRRRCDRSDQNTSWRHLYSVDVAHIKMSHLATELWIASRRYK